MGAFMPSQGCCCWFRSGRAREYESHPRNSESAAEKQRIFVDTGRYSRYVCKYAHLHLVWNQALQIVISIQMAGVVEKAQVTLVLVTFYMPWKSMGISQLAVTIALLSFRKI